MQYVEKAILDTVQGANANREDLSNVISLTDGPPRPVTQSIAQVAARNTTHQWNEVALNTAGRTNVAGGGATYAENALPNAAAKAPSRKMNTTCNVGRLAQVSDNEMAAFNGGGTVQLADGEMERQIQDALDFETALTTVEVLNQVEWMHITGDSSNATMEGKETDGLIKWVLAGGYVVSTADGNTGTTTTPVAMAEGFLKDGARGAAKNMPADFTDTLLVPPELIPDINSYVANGAGRPIVVDASGENKGIVGGHQVGYYNTGFSVLTVKTEPYLSPAYNTSVTNSSFIAFKAANVKQANLLALGAKPLAITTTGISRLVNVVFAQEHRNAKHAFIAQNLKSAIS